MANWSSLVNYVTSNYKVSDQQPEMLKLVFDTGDLRSQVVFLWRQVLGEGEEWVQIESPVAELGLVDLPRALTAIGGMVCGALAVVGGHVVVRHSAPLENLNINEFERPLLLVTTTADRLERDLVGGDQY